MKNKILNIILGALILILIGNASATLGTYKQGTCVPIITALNSSYVNITAIASPNGIITTNVEMTKIGNNFNYTFCTTNIVGTYTYGYCDNQGNCYGNDFIITNQGDMQDNGLTQTAFYIMLALIVAGFIYLKVSRFFGSMLIFVIGLGTLYAITNNGWIGYIIMTSGFLMIIYSLVSPKKSKRHRRF